MPHEESDATMKKETNGQGDPDMKDEYDFSKGIRGKHARYRRPGIKMVMLDPEVAAAFPDAESVNRALREVVDVRHKSK